VKLEKTKEFKKLLKTIYSQDNFKNQTYKVELKNSLSIQNFFTSTGQKINVNTAAIPLLQPK